MKKVLCYVFYRPFITIKYKKEKETVDYKLGLFADEKVARTAVEVSRNIMDKMRNIEGIDYIGFDNLAEILVPEDRSKSPYFNENLIKSIEEFCVKDAIVYDYVKKNGQNALQEVIAYEKERVAQIFFNDEDMIVQ